MSNHVLQTIFHRTNPGKSTVNRATICGEHVNLCEFIENRLYFVTLSSTATPKDCTEYHYFNIDSELVYLNYAADFGPLNLANIAKYFELVNSKLSSINGSQKIVHYTSTDPNKRANAAFLIAAYATVYLHKNPKEAYQLLLVGSNPKPFKPFQDAAASNSCHLLRILDCLEGLSKARRVGFIRFEDFNANEYDYFSYIRHGDLNWIVPKKLIAFSGPVTGINTPYRPPEHYIKFFKENGVTTVIRLNKRAYDSRCFTMAGIDHKELYFLDGSCPPKNILQKFLQIVENSSGAIAVHCKAGLGRTGSLIGAYLMKHYRMSAKEAIAWMRIVRPGSVIGNQQTWLEDHEELMWGEGVQYRITECGDPETLPFHQSGINSYENLAQSRKQPERILKTNTVHKQLGAPHLPETLRHSETHGLFPKPRTNPHHSGCAINENHPGPSFPDKSTASQPSVKSLFYSPTQKGRRHAYVPGKVTGSIPSVVNGRLSEATEKKDDQRRDTQGDKLRRAKVTREKRNGSQAGLERRVRDRSPP